MSRANRNIGPVGLSVLLHVMIFASMIIGFDVARPTQFTPLAVRATLVQEVPEQTPPPPVVEPQPEPEPVIEEPEPDNSEEQRRRAEEEKRRQDTLLEQKRLEELKRKEEEERRQTAREEAERKKREEEELERKRQEAERKRQEDEQRQREENERQRREFEAAQRQAEIEDEANRMAAVDAGELAVYTALIQQKIYRNLSLPASARDDLKCSVRVRQVRGGVVQGVSFLTCNGDDAVKRAIEAAIFKSSPLPNPPRPNLFDPNILLNLTKQQ